MATSQRIIEHLQESVERKELQDPRQIKFYLKREVQAILQGSEKRLDVEREKPFVILVIGRKRDRQNDNDRQNGK